MRSAPVFTHATACRQGRYEANRLGFNVAMDIGKKQNERKTGNYLIAIVERLPILSSLFVEGAEKAR